MSEMDQGDTVAPEQLSVTPAPHSPLPWRADGQGVLDCSKHELLIARTVESAITVCVRGKFQSAGISHEEANANAAFIVRAANNHYALVEALEAARERLNSDAEDGAPGWKGAQRLVEQIVAALSAAKGET